MPTNIRRRLREGLRHIGPDRAETASSVESGIRNLFFDLSYRSHSKLGKKILFIDRFNNCGEAASAGLRSLTGGHIVGVTVDALDQLWFADYDNKLVEGPFPLS
jgi:hypothetical protein